MKPPASLLERQTFLSRQPRNAVAVQGRPREGGRPCGSAGETPNASALKALEQSV